MANNRISKEKQVFILAALSEGTPINAVCRMFGVGKNGVLRVIAETGEALIDYMIREFRDLPVARLEMDEAWQYVGKHGQRMATKEEGRGDFWLWAAIDADTKLVINYHIGGRKWTDAEDFVRDTAKRISGPVQITTDALASYAGPIRAYFAEGTSYTTETKNYGDAKDFNPASFPQTRKNGIPKIVKAERKEVFGNPCIASSTVSHCERLFLTIRQQATRFTRLTLGYSKCIRMHKLATALQIGLYNLVRKHSSLDGQTPAQAAGVEEKRWMLEDVVAMTEAYWAPKLEAQKADKAFAKRLAEDAVFADELARIEESGMKF